MNEIFFYGGVITMGVSSIVAIVTMVILKLKKHNLNNEDVNSTADAMKSYKTIRALLYSLVFIIFSSGASLFFIGIKRMESAQQSLIYAEKSAIALDNGNINEAVDYAMKSLPDNNNIFVSDYTSYGQKALIEALGIYNKYSGFNTKLEITQPEEINEIVLSNDGKTLALLCGLELVLVNTETNITIDSFTTFDKEFFYPLDFDFESIEDFENLEESNEIDFDKELYFSNMQFITNDYFIFTINDQIQVYSLLSEEIVYVGDTVQDITVSADNNIIAVIFEDDDFATIFDLENETIEKATFYGETRNEDNGLFTLNYDGSLLVTSFPNGGIHLNYLGKSYGYLELLEASNFESFDGGFYDNYLALVCYDGLTYTFSIIDIDNLNKTTGFDLESEIQVNVDSDNGIYLSNDQIIVKIDPVTGEQTNIAYIGDNFSNIKEFFVKYDYSLIITNDNDYYIFDPDGNALDKSVYDNGVMAVMQENIVVLGEKNSKSINLFKRNENNETTIFNYSNNDSYTEAKVSSDGTKLILFGNENIYIYSNESSVVYTVNISDLYSGNEILTQEYIRSEDGDYLKVTYSDGTVHLYDIEKGQIIDKYTTDLSDDNTKYFYTPNYKIQTTLYGAPLVYKISNNKLVGQLDDKGYLVNATEFEEFLILEYVAIDGTKFGQLLNNNLEIITELPNLTDVLNGELIFDDGNGVIRKDRIYSIYELKNMVI